MKLKCIMNEPEISFDGISKEDLLVYLKEKTKDLKGTQRKLTKLEERYLVVLKETKQLKKLIENFYMIMNESLQKCSLQVPGEEADKIAKFEPTCEAFSLFFLRIFESSKIGEKEMQSKIEEMQEKTKKMYFSEISELRQQLLSSKDRLEESEKRLNEHERVNFDSLLNELKSVSGKTNGNLNEKIRESDRTNEIINLRAEIRELKEKLSGQNYSREKTPTKNTKFDNEFRKNEIEYLDKFVQTELPSHYGSNGSKETTDLTNLKISSSEQTHQNFKSTSELKIFIKDLFVKYFQCEKKKLTEEKLLILNVLFDVLQFGFEERMEITKQVREKGKFGFFK